MRMTERTKKSTRIVALFVALLLLAGAVAVVFAACDDTPPPSDAERRAAALEELEKNVLAAFDENWLPDMEESEIVVLEACGSYVEAVLWTGLVAEVLDSSALVTSKLERLAAFAADEEGKALISETRYNSDAVIELINAVGLTSVDMSGLGFGFLRAVVEDIAGMYASLKTTLEGYYGKVVGSGQQDMAAAIERAERIISTMGDEEETASTLAALDEAEEDIKTLLTFIFDFEQILGTGESGTGLVGLIGSASSGEGALAGISDSEMQVWLTDVLDGLAEAGEKLTEEKLANVKNALLQVEECFDGFAQPVDAVYDILDSFGYLSSFVDEIPLLIDYAIAAFSRLYDRGEDGAYTYALVRRLKALAAEENEDLKEINFIVLAAEAFSSFAEEYSVEDTEKELRRLAESGDSRKNMLLYLGALFTKVSVAEEDVEMTEELAAMVLALLRELFDDMFHTSWRRYVLAPEVKRNENRLRVSAGFVLNMAESLNDILIENGEEPVEVTVTNSGPYTKEWYDEVTRIEKESVSRASAVTGNAVPSSAADMIAESLKESYADMERINRIAAMGYITDVESPAVAEVEEMLRENPMFVLFAILFLQN